MKVLHFGGGDYEKQVVRKRSEALFDLLQEKYTKDLPLEYQIRFLLHLILWEAYQIT